MNLVLPSQHLCQPIGDARTNYHDYYGAIKVLSDFAHYDCEKKYPFAYWYHGASYPIDTKFKNMLTLGITHDTEMPVWLHREEHTEFFPNSKRIHTIGQAYVYTDNFQDKKLGSVLIMPGHTIVPDRNLDSQLFTNYVNDVSQIYPPSENTYVCVNTGDLRNGYWLTEFSRAGYTVIAGSRHDDHNSYQRMKMLMGHFETVVSNVLGSHIAYAAAEGCRVGIWGEQVVADFALDVLAASIDFDYRVWRNLSEMEYPFLFTDPGSESTNEDWGRHILGYGNKCTRSQVKGFLDEACAYHERVRKTQIVYRVINKVRRIIRGL